MVIFGVIAISYGFGVYYLLPLSMVSFNFSLAMSIFFSILFGMIFSMAVIGINLMPYISFFILKILLIFEKKSTKLIVYKNLIAHSDRNRMTSLMFSLTLGFIIFLNIVCGIPFNVDLNEMLKHKGLHSIQIGRMNLPTLEIDTFLKKYEYAFEEFGAVTN